MLAYAGPADTVIALALILAVVGMLIYVVRTGPPPASFHRADRDPLAHVRPLGPRPFDWALDDPDLAPPLGSFAVFRPESFVHLNLDDAPELAR